MSSGELSRKKDARARLGHAPTSERRCQSNPDLSHLQEGKIHMVKNIPLSFHIVICVPKALYLAHTVLCESPLQIE